MHIFSQLKESARILHHIDFRCWRKINFEFSKLQIQKLHGVLDDIFNPLKPKLRQRILRHLISAMRRRNKNWHNKRQNNDATFFTKILIKSDYSWFYLPLWDPFDKKKSFKMHKLKFQRWPSFGSFGAAPLYFS